MKALFLNLLIFFLAITGLFAQIEAWEHYSSPTTILDYADQGDYMWVGTDFGLYKINKETLEKEWFNTSNSPLPNNHVSSTTVDQMGVFWIGTYDLALMRIDNNGNWTTLEIPDSIKLEDQNNQLYCMEFDQDNNLWIGTLRNIARFDGTSWKSWNKEPNGQQLHNIWDINFDDNGDPYFTGFVLYKMENDTIINLFDQNDNLFSYGEASIHNFNGSIWFVKNHFGISIFENNEWTEIDIWNDTLWTPEFPNGLENAAMGPDGTIYVTTGFNGVYEWTGEVFSKFTTPQIDAHNDGIGLFYIEDDGTSWVFSDISFSKYVDETLTTVILPELPVYDPYVINVKVSPQKDVYVMQGWSYISKYKDGEWSNLSFPTDTSFTTLSVYDMDFRSNNDIVIGTSQGIFINDGQSWAHWDDLYPAMPLTLATRIVVTPEDDLWIKSSYDVAHFNGSTWVHYTSNNSPLMDELVGDINVDSKGNIWIAQVNERLLKIDPEGNWTIWHSFNAPFPSANWNNKVYIDSKDNVWTVWGKDGLLKFDGENWTAYNEGLPFEGEHLSSITDDENGNFFLKGTYLYSWNNQGEWLQFNETNSLFPFSYYAYKLQPDNNGHLWVGTSLGLFQYSYESTITSVDPTPPSFKNDAHLSLFPNPVETNTQLSWENDPSSSSLIQIIDRRGVVLKIQQVEKGVSTIELSLGDLPEGMYWVVVKQGENRSVMSFVR